MKHCHQGLSGYPEDWLATRSQSLTMSKEVQFQFDFGKLDSRLIPVISFLQQFHVSGNIDEPLEL